MNQGGILLTLFVLLSSAPATDETIIQTPFAFQDRLQEGSQHLGFAEANVLQVGCLLEPTSFPVKQVTAKNIASGLVLTASPKKAGNTGPELYMVDPMPPFDPSKHMGVWEIRVKDESGNEVTAKTHSLNNFGQMPYIKGFKASGNPQAPLLSWSAPNEGHIPKNCSIKYEIRLLKGMGNQFYKSDPISDTVFQLPEGLIQSEDLSQIFIRIDTQGYDKNDSEHSLPLEAKSQSYISLKEALSNKE